MCATSMIQTCSMIFILPWSPLIFIYVDNAVKTLQVRKLCLAIIKSIKPQSTHSTQTWTKYDIITDIFCNPYCPHNTAVMNKWTSALTWLGRASDLPPLDEFLFQLIICWLLAIIVKPSKSSSKLNVTNNLPKEREKSYLYGSQQRISTTSNIGYITVAITVQIEQ